MNRTLIGLLIVCLTSPLLLADEPSTSASKPAAETVTVKRGTIDPSIDADGYFEAIDPLEVRIRPKAYQGELTILSVQPHGARVKAGDVLIQIDPKDLNLQLAAAENELLNAKAAVEKAQADSTLGEQADALALAMAKDDLDRAEKAVKWFEDVDGKQMLKQAELMVTQTKNSIEDQEDELNELRKMYKSEELTSATADIVVKRALRQLELTKIQLAMTEDREKKVREFDFTGAKQRVEFALDQEKQQFAALQATQAQAKVTRQTALTAAKAALAKSEENVTELKADQAAFTVKAPSDGVVLYGQLVQGNWQNSGPTALRNDDKVQPAQVLMTFYVPGKLRFLADIPANKSKLLSASRETRVVPATIPEASTAGTCGKSWPIATMKDGGAVVTTPVDLKSVDPQLKPGDRGSVYIAIEPLKDVLIVPIAAVQHGRVRLPGAQDGIESWKDVIIGAGDGENVEIKSGLKEGDEICPKAAK